MKTAAANLRGVKGNVRPDADTARGMNLSQAPAAMNAACEEVTHGYVIRYAS